jgi:hypothetical protein
VPLAAATLHSLHQLPSDASLDAGRGLREDVGARGSIRPASRRRGLVDWFARSGMRRAVAAFIGVVFILSCGEALIADACDGDATAVAIAEHAASSAELGQASRESDVPMGTLSSRDDVQGGTSAPARPHGIHICHCTHAHGGMLTLRTSVAAVIVPVAESYTVQSDLLPPSPALEPQLRPPAVSLVA